MKKPEGCLLAYYRSIPAYFNPITEQIIGRNWFWNLLVVFNAWWDFDVLGLEEVPVLIEDGFE